MPPKKAAGGAPSKKTEQKKKEKVIEDKTFGLKNKKGTKQQKFIQHVTTQVQHGNKSAKALEAAKHEERKKKEAAKDEIAELNKILKPVAAMPKIAKDVDPKSVLCVFFKQGMCGKGDKCKWSHDLAVERKTEKRSVYHDNRDEDNMENWDDAKLAEVVDKKHGEKEKLKPKTEIICKYFLEALENSKYGWFWECPNGDSCIYRHALPPGYVLKKDKKKLDEASKQDQITLEELVEKERAALGNNLTKVTIETFLAWKKRKIREKQKKKADKDTKKQQEYKAGRSVGLSGRDLFTFNPDLIADDDEDDDGDVAKYEAEPEEDELIAHDIDESMFMEGIDLDAIDGNDDQQEQVNGVAAFNEDLFDDGDLPPDDDENDCDLVANDVNKIRLKTNDE